MEANRIPMKKLVLLCIVSIILLSCSKKEQYYGDWSQYYATGIIKIKKDSISLSDEGSIWKTYPLKIEKNSLTFLDHTFQTTIHKDSLIFEGLTYEKDTTTPILEINLPKLKNYNFHITNSYEMLIHTRFGRIPNTNEYKLQLNDRYGNFEELKEFLFGSTDLSGHITPRLLLVCDKNAKMKDIEHIFHEMVKINAQVLYAVNDVTHTIIEDSVERSYLSYKHYITPIHNMYYEAKIDRTIPVDYSNFHPLLNYFEAAKSQFIFLVKNEFYIGKEKYTMDAFSKKLDALITENQQLVCLFDLDSDFKHNIIFNNILNETYQKQYDSIALEKYNTTYEKLHNKEKASVKALHPRKTIQNVSIPHFLSFEETPIEGLNFPFKNIKEEIPEAYFKK